MLKYLKWEFMKVISRILLDKIDCLAEKLPALQESNPSAKYTNRAINYPLRWAISNHEISANIHTFSSKILHGTDLKFKYIDKLYSLKGYGVTQFLTLEVRFPKGRQPLWQTIKLINLSINMLDNNRKLNCFKLNLVKQKNFEEKNAIILGSNNSPS